MTTRLELTTTLTLLATTVTSLSAAQPSAFSRLAQRLSRLNNASGAVLATAYATASTESAFVDIPVYYVPGPAQIAALQFDLVLPSGFVLSSIAPGPVTLSAQKSISFNAQRVLLFGLNQTVLTEGHLLTLRLALPNPTPIRLYPVGISNVVASNPQGQDAVLSGMAAPLRIQ